MAEAILVPQVGQDLTEAKIVAINVKLGDKVAKGDIVAEVESEKATFEVEAFCAGIVISLPFAVGDVAPVLEPLMHLGAAGETVGGTLAPVALDPVAAPAPVAATPQPPAPDLPAGRQRSSPLARRIAAQGGLDIVRLTGSGPRGAVVLRDVTAALQGSILAAFRPAPGVVSLQNGRGIPVVFLHGFGGELAAWRPLVMRIGVPNPMVGVDLAGHGAAPAASIASFAALVDDTAARLAAAGLSHVHLVGHSLGAAVATALADRTDMQVRSLTLIAPAGLAPGMNGGFIAGFLGARSEAALGIWMQSLVHQPSSLPAAMVRATFAARQGTDAAARQTAIAAALFEGDTQLFSIRAALLRVSCPARVIVGREDAILPAAHGLPPQIALHRLPGVGHLPQTEAAGLVARLVTETIHSTGGTPAAA